MQDVRTSSPLPAGKVNQLQEAMATYPDIKPRSVEWCLKLIDTLFKTKRTKAGLRCAFAMCNLMCYCSSLRALRQGCAVHLPCAT